MRIVVTGGGTYGHVSPLEPIVQSIKSQTSDKVEVLFIAQKNDRFAELLSAPEHVDSVIKIPAGKYRRYPNESRLQRALDVKTHLLNTRDLFFIAVGTIKSYFILRKFKPTVVFGKGGYVSVPVGWAAKALRIPLVIHESDTRPGMANRLLSSYASAIALGLPASGDMFKGLKTVYTGIPVREVFRSKNTQPKAELKRLLKLDADLPLVTVSGGSLGAGAINSALIAGLSELTKHAQVVHITGEANLADVRAQTAVISYPTDRYRAIGFTKEIDLFFKASDVVITRASATTFSELAILGVATILIPAKQLDDQQENARILEAKGVVRQVKEVEIEADKNYLVTATLELLRNDTARYQLESKIREVAKPDAADELATIILNNARKE